MEPLAAAQDRMAESLTDLTSLHELTERLARTATLDDALHEVLRAGAALVGARRGMIALEASERAGPERTVGLGLGRADLGHIETVPRGSASHARLLDGLADDLPAMPGGSTRTASGTVAGMHRRTGHAPHAPGTHTPGADGSVSAPASASASTSAPVAPAPGTGHAPSPEIVHPDIAADRALDPRHREVAARLGCAASYAVPLATGLAGRIAAAVWLYDEPARPTERQRHLLGRYLRQAAEHLAHHLDLDRARHDVAALREELLPSRLPRVPGVRLAVRHRSGPRGGGDWYDALPLPEGALGLAVGGVSGSGPGAMAAMARLRASLRAYAVMEGEDPVAVLSDLELLLRLTEPARSATALFAYAEPASRKVTVAGAGHCPPLLVGPARTEFVETTLSAPLGMLACWEAPSAELFPREGETLLLYSDGLLHRTGAPMDRALARLHAAVACAPPVVRTEPEALTEHVLRTVLPDGLADQKDHPEDVVLLAARF
ncbi:hypothetical protein GCM10027091_01810 [Streptomyces daliensis]